MLQLSGLSNKRESNESFEVTPKVRALNTNGAIRLNNAAAELIGVSADNLYLATANAGNTVYIGIGKPHTPQTDEKGDILKHSTGRVLTKNDGYGAKLKPSTHAKPHYTAMIAAAYTVLRAEAKDDDFKGVVIFTLGEPVEAEIDTHNDAYPTHKTTVYPLVFSELQEKEEEEEEENVEEEATTEDLQVASAEQSEEAQPGEEVEEEDEW